MGMVIAKLLLAKVSIRGRMAWPRSDTASVESCSSGSGGRLPATGFKLLDEADLTGEASRQWPQTRQQGLRAGTWDRGAVETCYKRTGYFGQPDWMRPGS